MQLLGGARKPAQSCGQEADALKNGHCGAVVKLPKAPKVQKCGHGLSDDSRVFRKTIMEDFDIGSRMVIYHYHCREHQQEGMFLVTLRMPSTLE